MGNFKCPLEYCGANLLAPERWLYWCAKLVAWSWQHWRQQSPTWQGLRCEFSWTPMTTVGTSYYHTKEGQHSAAPFGNKRRASLWMFFATISASLVIANPGIPPQQRIHDRYIMDDYLDSNKFSASQLHCLNCCWLFIQAVTLADAQSNRSHLDKKSELCGNNSLAPTAAQLNTCMQIRNAHPRWNGNYGRIQIGACGAMRQDSRTVIPTSSGGMSQASRE